MQQDAAVSTDRPDRILRLPAVLDRTGLSRSTLYRKIQEGTFPKQIALGVRTRGLARIGRSEWMQDPMSFARTAGGCSVRYAKADSFTAARSSSR